MSYKTFLIFPLLVLTVSGAFAQIPVKQTVVLKDGSRITGTIISDSSGYFKIRVAKPSNIVLNKNIIASVEKPDKLNFAPPDYDGYNLKFTAGILAGDSEEGNVHSLSIRMSNNYRFRKRFEAGAGTGIEMFKVVLIPAYASFSYYPFRSRVAPYFWFTGGYAFAISEYEPNYNYYGDNSGKTKGGFLFSTGAGMALYSWRGNAVTMGIGYRLQRIKYSQQVIYYWHESSVREIITNFKRFEINFGFIFR